MDTRGPPLPPPRPGLSPAGRFLADINVETNRLAQVPPKVAVCARRQPVGRCEVHRPPVGRERADIRQARGRWKDLSAPVPEGIEEVRGWIDGGLLLAFLLCGIWTNFVLGDGLGGIGGYVAYGGGRCVVDGLLSFFGSFCFLFERNCCMYLGCT